MIIAAPGSEAVTGRSHVARVILVRTGIFQDARRYDYVTILEELDLESPYDHNRRCFLLYQTLMLFVFSVWKGDLFVTMGN